MLPGMRDERVKTSLPEPPGSPLEPDQGLARLLGSLYTRIERQGYQVAEIGQALGWTEDLLAQAQVRGLALCDLIMICELIGESVADLSVELGWFPEQEGSSLKTPPIAPKDYLLARLVECSPLPRPLHPVREGWSFLDRQSFRRETLSCYHYLTWLIYWLDQADELDYRAGRRRRAKAAGYPLPPKYKPLVWPEPILPSLRTDVLDILLPLNLSRSLKTTADRLSASGRRIKPVDLLINVLESFLHKQETRNRRRTRIQKLKTKAEEE